MSSAASVPVILPKSVRRDLVRALDRLASDNPAERASSAQRVVELVQQRRLTWSQLLVSSVPDETVDAWPAPALELLEQPGVTEDDRATLRRLSAWRAPGKAGLGLLRDIRARVKAEAI